MIVVRCLFLFACYALLRVRYVLFADCCSLGFVWCVLRVVRCALRVDCRVLFVVHCLLPVVG